MDYLPDLWDYLLDHWAIVPGILAALLAALSWHGDRRRMRRRDPDRVGIMPWTTLFFWSFLAACLLLAAAVQDWLAGG